MSEQAPERPASPQRGSSGGKLGLFKERIGPLPMWVWVAIIAAVLIAWRLYADKKNKSAASTASTGDGSVGADQVPEFINQTYTTVTAPPSQPPPTGNPPATAPTSTPKSNPNPPPKAGAPGMPIVKPGRATSSSIAGAWARVAGATSYHWRVTYQDKLVKQGTTSSPNVTVSGLDPDHTYTLHVAAVGPGGASSETNGPGIKTTR